ncbi:DNA cytosine methyltransferase [Limosilactobacillus fermentum]|nr:DNA cytosine methyltransferase [Limosilactobacillus fermentum]MBM9561133.1 DNA cytosine methyltransferase [Limosilactobacillus fermentum]
MEFRMGELFSGPGGLALGAKLAEFTDDTGEKWDFKHSWANDFDQDTVETYKLNLLHNPDAKTVFCEDVSKFPIGDKSILPDIDALAFGFPCNDYSSVGKQKGLGGVYGPLYSYGVKVLKYYQPKVFIAENVGGLSSANEGYALVKILEEFQSSGYHITPNFYKFEEYGVPQARHRIIIVGIRNDLYEEGIHFHVPEPTTPDPKDMKTSQQAIEEPKIPVDAPNNEMPRTTKKVAERLSYIPEGENAWYLGIPEELRLNVRGAKLSSIYKRLDHTKPAYTVTGSGGGGTHMYHWKENRALTNRERARLQTFPDDFKFIGSKESVRKQIGMAVPPEGAKVVMEAVLKTFAGIEYPWVKPTEKLQLDNLLGVKKYEPIELEL